MGIAERGPAQHFNRPDFAMVDDDIYTVCRGGDMMQGVAGECGRARGSFRHCSVLNQGTEIASKWTNA
jgi:transketolase